jgi:hypothetical protein
VNDGIDHTNNRAIARNRAGKNDGFCWHPGSRYRVCRLVNKTTVPRLRAQDERILLCPPGSYLCLLEMWKGSRMKEIIQKILVIVWGATLMGASFIGTMSLVFDRDVKTFISCFLIFMLVSIVTLPFIPKDETTLKKLFP